MTQLFQRSIARKASVDFITEATLNECKNMLKLSDADSSGYVEPPEYGALTRIYLGQDGVDSAADGAEYTEEYPSMEALDTLHVLSCEKQVGIPDCDKGFIVGDEGGESSINLLNYHMYVCSHINQVFTDLIVSATLGALPSPSPSAFSLNNYAVTAVPSSLEPRRFDFLFDAKLNGTRTDILSHKQTANKEDLVTAVDNMFYMQWGESGFRRRERLRKTRSLFLNRLEEIGKPPPRGATDFTRNKSSAINRSGRGLISYDQRMADPSVVTLKEVPCWDESTDPYSCARFSMGVTVIDEMNRSDASIRSSLDRFLSLSFAQQMMQQLPYDSHIIGLKYIGFNQTLDPNIASNDDISYESLSSLTITGIVAGSFLVFLGISGLYLSMRDKLRRKRLKEQRKGTFQGDDDDAFRLPGSPQPSDIQYWSEIASPAAMNRYKQGSPPRAKSKDFVNQEGDFEFDDNTEDDSFGVRGWVTKGSSVKIGRGKRCGSDDFQSINSCSSGWSSASGISSWNTESADGEVDSINYGRPQNGGIQFIPLNAYVPSASVGKISLSVKSPVTSPVTRIGMDAAIASGDWATIGTTAALLNTVEGNNNFGHPFISSSLVSSPSTPMETPSTQDVNPTFAAELDTLLSAGDWEGVVLAASKTDMSIYSEPAAEVTGTEEGTENQSQFSTKGDSSTSISSLGRSHTSGGKFMKIRKDLRKKIEELIMDHIPEEIDHIDDMLVQFDGREDELIMSLESMQPRN